MHQRDLPAMITSRPPPNAGACIMSTWKLDGCGTSFFKTMESKAQKQTRLF